MRKLTIKVTEEDIRNGQPRTSTACPIALAAKRTSPDIEGICSEALRYYSHKWECTQLAELPESATNFVALFDSGCNVEPFSFYIELED